MTPALAALLGVLVGVLLAAAAAGVVLRRRQAGQGDASGPPSGDLRAILDALRAGAVLLGPHDEVLAVNAEAVRLGLVRGTRIAIPAVLDLVREARRTGEAGALNVDDKRAKGRVALQPSVRVVPVADERVFLAADDRAHLLRARESSREFMSNATHELKTPIGAISLLSEAVEDAAHDPHDVVRFARKIGVECARLSDLVSQIILLSKLRGDGVSTDARPVEVGDVVSMAVGRCRELAEARSVALTQTESPAEEVRGDAEQLVTAVSNLITNAICYSDPKARVVVATRVGVDDEEPTVDIAVSDNGIGIAPEDQERIFDRFYRVDFARSRVTGGTGLGLSIVSEIAEVHGGSVSVWSSPGSGSTFTLRLPVAAQADPEKQGDS